jgi:hypothetical protein
VSAPTIQRKCDSCERVETVTGDPSATIDGWRREGVRDFCPKCPADLGIRLDVARIGVTPFEVIK